MVPVSWNRWWKLNAVARSCGVCRVLRSVAALSARS